VAALLPGAPAQALVVLGMVAYFSGVVQAPITAFVIVAEMTNDHALVVPLMLTSLLGFAVSRLVCPEGVYHALAHNFLAAEAARHPRTDGRSDGSAPVGASKDVAKISMG
jgi:H+/Cl- antiporter ClcA